MTAGSRSARILVLVAEQAARRGARAGVADVCAAAVRTLPVGGAGVSVMSADRTSRPFLSTDDISERLEELQLTLGEGPCVDAFSGGLAVLTPDLYTPAVRARWPGFAPAAAQAGAAAVFAFPLQIGAISPGVLDLYAKEPGDLDREAFADAMAFAEIATLFVLDSRSDGPDGGIEGLGGYRTEVDQATGMLTEQLGVGIEEAFVRLRAHSYGNGRRLAEVAADIVAHRLRFSPDPKPADDEI